MNATSFGEVVGAVSAIFLALTFFARPLRRNKQVETSVAAQQAAIEALESHVRSLTDDLQQSNVRAAQSDQRIAGLEAENRILREVVTSKKEIEALHRAEDAHHAETITVLREIKEAVNGRTAAVT